MAEAGYCIWLYIWYIDLWNQNMLIALMAGVLAGRGVWYHWWYLNWFHMKCGVWYHKHMISKYVDIMVGSSMVSFR